MSTSTATALEGYTIKSVRTEDDPNWGSAHRAFKTTITNPRGRRYTTPFRLGLDAGPEPRIEDVLQDLLSNAAGYTSTQDFEEWAREYGYTWETRGERRRVLAVYNHCARQAAKVETFFTAEELELVIAAVE